MHFNSVVFAASSARAARTASASAVFDMGRRADDSQTETAETATVPKGATTSTLPPAPLTSPAPAGTRDALLEASQNLLKHIPGEASGFYLLAVDSIKEPSLGNLGLIFTLAFVLLVVVRWLAKASWGIMITTILAFALWMLIFDKGFLHVLLPNLLPAPMGLIVAVFYSMLITLLASAGKIR